ncbi:MAG: cbb3-type cytochrome c oxidase N-terminal domain-containing protein [Myxococcota bacterium]
MNKSYEPDPIQGEVIHEYDGIREADNNLPQWWLSIFFATIVFSFGYWFYYHSLDIGDLPLEAYAADLASRAEEGGEITSELLLAAALDSGTVAQGKQTFAATCAPCHGAAAEGNIGPNLTDDHWIHGGGSLDIHRMIDKGIAEKGMPAWGAALGQKSVTELTAFVLSLRGTNQPGKGPEGVIWSGQETSGAEDYPQEPGSESPQL